MVLAKLFESYYKQPKLDTYFKLLKQIKDKVKLALYIKRQVYESKMVGLQEMQKALDTGCCKDLLKGIRGKFKLSEEETLYGNKTKLCKELMDRRLVPFALSIIGEKDFYRKHIPDNILQYAKKLAVLFSRILYIRKSRVSETVEIKDVTRLIVTFSLYQLRLRSIVDNKILNALDFNSLVRLSIMAGGESLKVPTLRELECALAGAYYTFLVLYKKLPQDKAAEKIKQELNIKIVRHELTQEYKILAMLFSQEMKEDTSTVNELLGELRITILEIQKALKSKSAHIDSSEEFVNTYVGVNSAITDLFRNIQ